MNTKDGSGILDEADQAAEERYQISHNWFSEMNDGMLWAAYLEMWSHKWVTFEERMALRDVVHERFG